MTTLPRLACVCVKPQANFGILARIRFLSWPMLGLLRYRLPLKFLSDMTKLKKMSFCRNAAWLTESHCGIQTLFENSLPILMSLYESYHTFSFRGELVAQLNAFPKNWPCRCFSRKKMQFLLLDVTMLPLGACVCNPPAAMRASCGIQPTNIIYIYWAGGQPHVCSWLPNKEGCIHDWYDSGTLESRTCYSMSWWRLAKPRAGTVYNSWIGSKQYALVLTGFDLGTLKALTTSRFQSSSSE